MKPFHADSFPLFSPAESDLEAIEAALAKLMQPLGRLPEMHFSARLRNGVMRLELPEYCTLLGEGERPKGVYFLVYGSLLVGTNLGGDMQLSDILRSNDFVLPLKLFSNGHSVQELRTTGPCRLLFMDVFKYNQILEDFPDAGTLTNLWRDQWSELDVSRKLELKNMDAFGRMRWLYRKWPDCFQAFSDGVIGAYLGLTRETVCRNKGKVLGK